MTTVSHDTNPFGKELERGWLTDLENSTDFWNRSPQLQAVAWAAAQEKISPWGLLMGVQLHQLSHVKPTVVLVKRNGQAGTSLFSGTSLNMFGGLTGDSGAGKSMTFKLAMELLPPAHTPISDGTGQGLVKSIAETEKVTMEDGQKLPEPYYVTRFNRHSLVIHAPEIKTLNAEFAREASKTDSMMRSMWSGETVGMTTGDRDRRVTLPSNMYRVVGMWGVQAINAGAILAGSGDGTPQRWLWMPVAEYRIGIHATRVNPGQVTFPTPVFGQVGANPFGTSGGELPTEYRDGDPLPPPIWVHWSPQMHTDIAALQARREALLDREPHAQNLTNEQKDAELAVAMESHLILTRIKLAAIMGFLHGRPNPTDEDWELAGIQLQVSVRELSGTWIAANEANKDEIITRGSQKGLEMHAAQAARDKLGDADLLTFVEELYSLLAVKPLLNDEIRKGLSTSRRNMLTRALEILDYQGRFARDKNNLYWALHKGHPIPAHLASQFVPK